MQTAPNIWEVLFKVTEGGYVFRAPNPWFVCQATVTLSLRLRKLGSANRKGWPSQHYVTLAERSNRTEKHKSRGGPKSLSLKFMKDYKVF